MQWAAPAKHAGVYGLALLVEELARSCGIALMLNLSHTGAAVEDVKDARPPEASDQTQLSRKVSFVMLQSISVPKVEILNMYHVGFDRGGVMTCSLGQHARQARPKISRLGRK